MTDPLEFGREVLRQQPFSRLLGAELTAFSPENTELRLPVRDDLRQQHGIVHGGVMAYLADNALTFAGGTVLGAKIVTMEFKINYVRRADGDTLIARAQVVHAGKRQAVCRCDIFAVRDDTEMLVAVAQGTIAALGDSDT